MLAIAFVFSMVSQLRRPPCRHLTLHCTASARQYYRTRCEVNGRLDYPTSNGSHVLAQRLKSAPGMSGRPSYVWPLGTFRQDSYRTATRSHPAIFDEKSYGS
jgi:hypothetical protein